MKEVQDYIVENVSAVLKSADIRYVKWDYNRNLSDFIHQIVSLVPSFMITLEALYAILNGLRMHSQRFMGRLR